MATKADNFRVKQLHLLERWAQVPEQSPLTPAPDLWDIDFEYEEEDDEKEEEDEDEEEDEHNEEDNEESVSGLSVMLPQGFDEFKKERKERQKRQDSVIVERIQDWFLENFEPPALGSSYDEYIWGGPYDAHTVITRFFPDHTTDDNDGEDDVTSLVLKELERRSTAWVPSGSRLEPPVAREAPRSPRDAYERTQQSLRALKELLERIPEQPAGIGHNYPPEPLDDYPLSGDDQKELSSAVSTIESQPLEPADNGEQVKAAAAVIETKAQKVKSWLARQGDTFITEAVKESGKQFGKWMPRAFWMFVIERMLGVTETITVWLKMVFPAI
jgi:hypothetical protein